MKKEAFSEYAIASAVADILGEEGNLFAKPSRIPPSLDLTLPTKLIWPDKKEKED
jgi:hypothetical protein